VNPLFALVAERHEPAHAADWFILRALGTPEWARVKKLAHDGRIPVVTVDSNVVRFDPAFRTDVGARSMRRLLTVEKPPINTTLFGR
jgi:hypothetical protein